MSAPPLPPPPAPPGPAKQSRPSAPPPPAPNGAQRGTIPTTRKFDVVEGVKKKPIKAVIYGSGGIGKSELASLLSRVGQKMLFVDIEQGSSHLAVNRIDDVQSYDELRSILHDSDLLSKYDGVVIDSLTKAEELAADWVIRNIPHEKGKRIVGIEDYGFGKGFTHIYEALVMLLGDLDSLVRSGKHVVCIAHNCIATPENPDGENFSKEQPRLQTSKDGKNSFRYRILEWTDHLLCIRYDIAVVNGKGVGCGSRTIYTQEMPQFWAKSRTLTDPVVYEKDSPAVWQQILGTTQ